MISHKKFNVVPVKPGRSEPDVHGAVPDQEASKELHNVTGVGMHPLDGMQFRLCWIS